MAPEQVFDLCQVTRTNSRAGQSQPLGTDFEELDLIALGEWMTDRQDEHQRLAPAAVLLKTIERPAIQRESDIGSAVVHELGSFAMRELTNLDHDFRLARLQLEQQARERLSGEILRQRQSHAIRIVVQAD